jgi:alkaline phosphatase
MLAHRTGLAFPRPRPARSMKIRLRPPLLALVLTTLAAAGCTALQVGPGREAAPQPERTLAQAERPRNVVLMIADGLGPAAATLGRAAKGAPLALDGILAGAIETSATDNRVTDSAASATAFACGIRTYRGAIAVDTTGAPCLTVLEAAETRGMATGLVVTSRITDATPAAFAAHAGDRDGEAAIARQMAASGVDLLFGGGARFFTGPASAAPLAEVMAADGWTVALDRAGYDALAALPAAAFLAASNLAYEIDRDGTDQPSLAEMTEKALDLLAAEAGEHGFFLVVEGSRIDDAAHRNDPAALLRDVLAYDRAVAAALAWAARDGNTLVVSTADHETGGLTLGRDNINRWDPAPLLRATASFEAMAARIGAGYDPAETIRQGLGYDALPEGAAEVFLGAVAANDPSALLPLLMALASEPAGIGWTTRAHTGVDVGLHAWGPGAELFRGVMASDAVGRALFAVLGLETARAGR